MDHCINIFGRFVILLPNRCKMRASVSCHFPVMFFGIKLNVSVILARK